MSSLINMRHHKHNNKKKAQSLNFTAEMDTGNTTSLKDNGKCT